MTKPELRNKLISLGIRNNHYSLEGELIPDAVVLFQNYSVWEVFYCDERGSRHEQKTFKSEEEACNYIFKLFKEGKAIEEQFGLNT